MSAMEKQVAGNHYVKLAVQPFHFAMANRYDPSAFSILKYVTRFEDKHGAVDLEKALHFVDLREFLIRYAAVPLYEITMDRYIVANGFKNPAQILVLRTLDQYLRTATMPEVLKSTIQKLQRQFYGS